MTIETYIVDAFTDAPFKGNPAGVCLLEEELSEAMMLSIASELGFSETAFVHALPGENHYSIRFFSPKIEIPLCGHATLASSKVLFEKRKATNLHFKTIEDLDLHISKIAADRISMLFPIYDTHPMAAPPALLQALGLGAISNSAYNAETNILLLEIADSQTLKALKPDFEALVRSHDSINGVLITAPSQRPEYDFESRYFWPWSGTNEDPVTGATHTFLTKYWSKRLDKKAMRAFQCSHRTGFLDVELLDDKQMTITSNAVILLAGKLHV